VGLSDKTDVLQSQASYDTARANRILAQRQVEDAFEALVTLTNRQYNAIQGIAPHPARSCRLMPNDAKAWVDTAARQNLNLLASNYAVTAAEETLKQRKAGHAPTLDAVAQYEDRRQRRPRPQQPQRPRPALSRRRIEQRTIGLQPEYPALQRRPHQLPGA
jgi:outer membrane protein